MSEKKSHIFAALTLAGSMVFQPFVGFAQGFGGGRGGPDQRGGNGGNDGPRTEERHAPEQRRAPQAIPQQQRAPQPMGSAPRTNAGPVGKPQGGHQNQWQRPMSKPTEAKPDGRTWQPNVWRKNNDRPASMTPQNHPATSGGKSWQNGNPWKQQAAPRDDHRDFQRMGRDGRSSNGHNNFVMNDRLRRGPDEHMRWAAHAPAPLYHRPPRPDWFHHRPAWGYWEPEHHHHYRYWDPLWGIAIFVPVVAATVYYTQSSPPPATVWVPTQDPLYAYAGRDLLPGLANIKRFMYPGLSYELFREQNWLRIETNIPTWTGDANTPGYLSVYVTNQSDGPMVYGYGDYTSPTSRETVVGTFNTLEFVKGYANRLVAQPVKPAPAAGVSVGARVYIP